MTKDENIEYYVSMLDELLNQESFVAYSGEWLLKNLEINDYYIWGAGTDGNNAKILLQRAGYKIIGIIDINASEGDCTRVKPCQELFSQKCGLILASRIYEGEMDTQLRSYKIKENIKVYNYCHIIMSLVRDFFYFSKETSYEKCILYGADTQLFFGGDYRNFSEANMEVSDKDNGYDATVIFESVKNAFNMYRRGEAVFERDGIPFKKEENSFEILSAVLYVSSVIPDCVINVLDFGGSLGSTYFQNKKWIDHLNICWNIVEQERIVAYGQKYIPEISFFKSIEECYKKVSVNCIVISSVLQYLDKPYEYLERLFSCKAEYILIDRTPMIEEGESIVVNQNVPKSIYKAVYPAWLFNKMEFERYMSDRRWEMITSWKNKDHIEWRLHNEQPIFCGYIFKRA